MSIYPSVIRDLEKASKSYRDGGLGIEKYKGLIWKAASQIVSIEEKDFRDFLKQAEAEIDSVQFTINEDRVFEETLKIVDKVEGRLSLYQGA